MKSDINIEKFIEHYSMQLLSPDKLRQSVSHDARLLKDTTKYSPFSSALHSGLPGIIFLANEVHKQGILRDNSNHIDDYIQLLLDNVKSDPVYDVSLFGGIPGVGTSLICLDREDLSSVIRQLNTTLFSLLDIFLERQEQEIGSPTKSQNFDLMYGLSGTLSYLLLCYKSKLLNEDKGKVIEYIKKIENSLVKRYKHSILVDNNSIPAWYISSKNQMSKEDIIKYPHGNFNISMSHGISGMTIVLLNSLSLGIVQPGVKDLLRKCVSFIESSTQEVKGILNFPLMVPVNEKLRRTTVKSDVRFDSWCYGAPGILLSLYKYASLINDSSLLETCIKNFNYINDRPMGLASPSICHGYAGLISIIHFASESVPSIHDVNQKLYSNLFQFYTPKLKLGFCNQEFLDSKHSVYFPDAGILTGVSGIILALISAKYGCKSGWTKVFNIEF